MLTEIVRLGITLVTLMDGRRYNVEELNKDPMCLMYAVLIFMRSNEESQAKSRRLRAAWGAKRKAAADNGKIMTTKVPHWLSVKPDRSGFVVDKKRAKVIKSIFDQFTTGFTLNGLANDLNKRGVPTGTKATLWTTPRISKLLRDVSVVGTKVLKETVYVEGKQFRREVGEVKDYYPAIVDQGLFDQVQLQLEQRQSKMGSNSSRPLRNAFAGLLKCSSCGSGVARSQNHSRPILVCSTARYGGDCNYHSIHYDRAHDAMTRSLNKFEHEAPLDDEGSLLDGKLMVLIDQAEEIQERIEVLLSLAEKGDNAAFDRYRKLEADLGSISKQIDAIIVQRDQSSSVITKARLKALREAVEAEDIPAINKALRLLVTKVDLSFDNSTLTFHWRSGLTSDVWFGEM